MAALAGANLIYGAGMIESGITFDFAQLVMDNEFARMIKHVVGGIPVNDETLSVEVIAEVGPFSDFLSHQDTFRRMREQSRPTLMDRRVYEDWDDSGGGDIYGRARGEARTILETHEVEPLPEDVAAEVREIVANADSKLTT